MNASEAITLEAFLIALCQLDVTLPDPMRRAIHHMGEELAQHQTKAIDRIPELIKEHQQLHELYRAACILLKKRAEPHVQMMGMMVEQASSSLNITLQDMAAQILTANDFKAAAQYQIRQATARRDFKNAPTEIKQFLEALGKAVLTLGSQMISVLHALERRPLSVENLSYTLQMSRDQVEAIVKYLWSAGYINSTKDSVIHKLFPALRGQISPQQIANPDAIIYFTLTAKGHFYLHPLVTLSRREV